MNPTLYGIIQVSNGSIDFSWSRIGGNVFLQGASLKGKVSFRGAHISKEFTVLGLEGYPKLWESGASLSLKNATISAISDGPNAWPGENGSLDVGGLVYDRFDWFRSEDKNQPATKPGKWFVKWLAKSEPFSPQPYRQCAKVLRAAGHTRKANQVMTALYERRRLAELKDKKQGWLGRYLWRTTEKWGIGYGLGAGYFRALGWGAGLAIFGWFLAMLSHPHFVPDPGADYSLSWLYFSLDQVIPIVELAHKNSDIMDGMNVWLKGWFVIQKLAGWILALLVIAGLTGLVGRKED